MGDKTAIQWADATWNPTTGCDRVSPGCANCYALTLAPRLQDMALAKAVKDGMGPFPTDPYMRDGDPKTSGRGFGLMLHPDRLDQPLRWKRPRRIFVNSMSDLGHPEVPDGFLDLIWATMALAPQHQFLILTKRPERMREYLTANRGPYHVSTYIEIAARDMRPGFVLGENWPLRNVWLGTSVENARWRTRIDELRQTPAAIRFLSCEPLLGPLTKRGLDQYDREDWPRIEVSLANPLDLTGIDWVIIGGESGPGARPMEEAWVRGIIAECRRQGAAAFTKQLGDRWSMANLGHHGHGGDIETFPADLRVREYPA